MTDSSKHNFDDDDIKRLVKSLPSVEAEPHFREQLRNSFASGQIDPGRVEKRTSRKGISLFRWWYWAAPVAAAAVLLLVINALNHLPSMRVLEVTGSGEARVDGRVIALSNVDALTASFHAGADIEIPPGTSIDLLVDDVMLFEIAGGTHMTIPPVPGRWFGRSVACSLLVGEMRVKTGKKFPGSQLRVLTPEGIVEIAATMLSIQRSSGGTCVCVLEGVAHVGVDENDLEPVRPGFRKVMLSDGTTKIIPVLPLHRDGVLDFDERVGQEIQDKQ